MADPVEIGRKLVQLSESIVGNLRFVLDAVHKDDGAQENTTENVNEADAIDERLAAIMEQTAERGETLEALAGIGLAPDRPGVTEDMRDRLRSLEQDIQMLLPRVHAAFSGRLKKLQQGKTMANRYQQSYGDYYSDGAFIDKRK